MKQLQHPVQLTPVLSSTKFLSIPRRVVLTKTPTIFLSFHPFVLALVSPHQSALFTNYLFELRLSCVGKTACDLS
jgi:hypothetical protein